MKEEKSVLKEEDLDAVVGGGLYMCEVFTHKSGTLCIRMEYRGEHGMGSKAIRAIDFAKFRESHANDTFVGKDGKSFVLDL